MKSAVFCLAVIVVVSTLSAAQGKTEAAKLLPIKPVCRRLCRRLCPSGTVLDSCSCKCKPSGGECPRYGLLGRCRSCKYGRTFYTDSKGCRRCKCKPRPSTGKCRLVQCRMFCPNGFVKDKNGCNICRCKPFGGRKPCRYRGKTYPHGSSFKKDCNRCFCNNGRAACTKKGCLRKPRI